MNMLQPLLLTSVTHSQYTAFYYNVEADKSFGIFSTMISKLTVSLHSVSERIYLLLAVQTDTIRLLLSFMCTQRKYGTSIHRSVMYPSSASKTLHAFFSDSSSPYSRSDIFTRSAPLSNNLNRFSLIRSLRFRIFRALPFTPLMIP